jgi:Flp pilus assembly pilin Flp
MDAIQKVLWMPVAGLWQDDQGQDLIEYSLLMAFVALASVAIFSGVGGSVKGIWSSTNSQLTKANTTAS